MEFILIRLLTPFFLCFTPHINFSAGQPNTGDVRLVPNAGLTAREGGLLEVYLNDQWGAVCVDGFRQNEGDVACRQLGYQGVIGYGSVRSLGFNEPLSSTPIWLDGLRCCGDEERLVNCSHGGIGITQCSHANEVAVICYGVSTAGNPTNGTLRLNTEGVSFPRIHSGRLEVYWNGEWGTVCDDGFGQMEADMACVELGYKSALFYDNVDRIGVSEASSDAPIWLSHLTCSPGNTRLTDCVTTSPLGTTERCFHYEDIALVCVGPGSIQLVNEFNSTYPTTSSGRLEIYVRGEWGVVCAETFDQSDADVTCRQNGDSRAYDFGPVGDLGYMSNPNAPVRLQCSDDTTSFLICPSDGLNVSGCGQQVALSCSRFFQRPRGDNTALAVGVTLGTIAACVIFVLIIVSIPFCKLEWWCCLCRRYFKWRRDYKESLNRTRSREELENDIIIEPILNYSRESQEPPAPYSQPSSQPIENFDANPLANPNLLKEVMLTYANTPPPDPPKPAQALTSEGPPTYRHCH